MEPRVKFFKKLRHLTGHLEKETERLKEMSETQNSDDMSGEGCLSTLHNLKSEVREVKMQLQQHIAKCHEERVQDLDFIETWSKKREEMRAMLDERCLYYEQYGYKPREPAPKPSEPEKAESAEVEDEEEEELVQDTGEEEEGDEEAEEDDGNHPSGPAECTPERIATPSSLFQEMCTPKLTDFGLSELHLQNMLKNCGVLGGEEPVPPPPKLLFSPVAPAAVQPPVPKTPKCHLRLEEDAPTPRLEDFGISEYTMRLNNDFTMDLFRGQRPSKDAREPPDNEIPLLASKEFMGTPETPELMTPGLSLKKAAVACTPSETPERQTLEDELTSPIVPTFQTPYLSRLMAAFKDEKSKDSATQVASQPPDVAHQESPQRQADDLSSPEVPTFQTPYLAKLMSSFKDAKSKSKDSTGLTAGPSDCVTLTSPPPDVSQPCISVTEEAALETPTRLTSDADLPRTPQMPILQSFHTLQQYSVMEAGSASVISIPGDAGPSAVDLHETQTQEWSLASPRVRMEYDYDARTPEMPDVSSITQDIFKLVSQCNTEMKSAAGSQPALKAALQTTAPGKENRLVTRPQSLSLVTEAEFGALTACLKQVPLTKLNDAIHELNNALLQRHHGGHSEPREFLMEELRSIMGNGAKPSLQMMCLIELGRVRHIHGAGNNALYRLLPTQT